MSENKTCGNGHIYSASEKECPYCPSKTVVEGATVAESNTENNETIQDKTEIISEQASDRTVIHQADPESTSQSSEPLTGRKLVGWLVSYSWNKEGQDYQLREGKTLIGAGSECDITVGDSEVSAHHSTILYRGGVFRIKDEFSTNGTIINGEEIVDQTEMKDGDKIKSGDLVYLVGTGAGLSIASILLKV